MSFLQCFSVDILDVGKTSIVLHKRPVTKSCALERERDVLMVDGKHKVKHQIELAIVCKILDFSSNQKLGHWRTGKVVINFLNFFLLFSHGL